MSQHQPIRELYHLQIVDDSAVLVGEHAVALACAAEPNEVGGKQLFESSRGILYRARAWPNCDLAHVRDVEEPGGGARVQMLFDDA